MSKHSNGQTAPQSGEGRHRKATDPTPGEAALTSHANYLTNRARVEAKR